MNPKLQESGRKGGSAGKGASKVRPLTPSKASEMARARWDKVKCPKCGTLHSYGTLWCKCGADIDESNSKKNQL